MVGPDALRLPDPAGNSGSDESTLPSGRFAILIGILVVVVCVYSGWFFWDWDTTKRGTLGDSFGIANAVFSGLAFVGLVYAILLQREDLKLQREELRQTREELAGQKQALNAQNETLRKQSFESTFFQLLNLHNDIVNAIDLIPRRNPNGPGIATRGRDCFKVFFGRLRHRFGAAPPDEQTPMRDRINRVYLRFYRRYQHELGHYFRTLYNIVKFVDRSDVKDKTLYTNLIRAQLSSHEQLLLFYNSLSDIGAKFKPLIERYALLKTLPQHELVNGVAEATLYAPDAYGAGEIANQGRPARPSA